MVMYLKITLFIFISCSIWSTGKTNPNIKNLQDTKNVNSNILEKEIDSIESKENDIFSLEDEKPRAKAGTDNGRSKGGKQIKKNSISKKSKGDSNKKPKRTEKGKNTKPKNDKQRVKQPKKFPNRFDSKPGKIKRKPILGNQKKDEEQKNNTVQIKRRPVLENQKKEENQKNDTSREKVKEVVGTIVNWEKCGQTIKLGDGDRTYFYSEGSKNAVNCKLNIKADKKAKIMVKCQYIDLVKKGCKMEKIVVSGGFKPKTICKKAKLSLKTTGKKTLTLHHTRKAKVVSGGFVCEITTQKIQKPMKCKKSIKMAPGDSMMVTSDGKTKKRSCQLTIINDDSLLSVYCPKMSLCTAGCKCESITLKEDGGEEYEMCEDNQIKYYESTASEMMLWHKRINIPKSKYSGGFVCYVYAHERPYETTTGSYYWSSTTDGYWGFGSSSTYEPYYDDDDDDEPYGPY